MKVLLVSPLPPPMGGIASWTIHVLAYFKRNDENIDLIHYNTGGGKRRITDLTFLKRIYFGLFGLYRIISDIEKTAADNNVNIIHITSSASLGLFRDFVTLLKLSNLQAKTCIHFRFGRIPQLSIKKNWEWKLLKTVCKMADKVIVIDIQSYKTLQSEGLKNVFYLPNPLSEEIETKVKNSPVVHRGKGSVLFVGHIIPAKGVYELVTACSQLTEVTNLTLIGPYEKSVHQDLMMISEKKGCDGWIGFTGNKDQSYIIDKMKECSVFVLPSYTEGFPNVILESMASAAPVIATNVGAIPEMLDEKNTQPAGICVNSMDVDVLRDEIKEVLNNPLKSNRMGELAQKRVFEEYSMKIVVEKLINIWNKN